MTKTAQKGPLSGLRIIEFAGIGPAPMASMLLADMGAEVIRVDRMTPAGVGISRPVRYDLLTRGRRSVAINLKHPDGIACVLELISKADGLIEGFRPGTMEKLGLGPDHCLKINPRLVYGRLTGWGQEGPLAQSAGHDLNYIALTGALDAIGRAGEPPTPPLNLLGDYGGGGMFLAFGLLCGLLNAQRTGEGQVVDAAMVDGTSLLMTSMIGLYGAGLHRLERGTNLLDSGAPHYEVYRCADDRYISIAPIEAKFRKELLTRIGFDPETFPDLNELKNWPHAKQLFATRFAEKTVDEWCSLLEESDACFAPVLSMSEAANHPHNRHRKTFIKIDGITQPAPGPRFSRTPVTTPSPPEQPGSSTYHVLSRWGFSDRQIKNLETAGAIGAANQNHKENK